MEFYKNGKLQKNKIKNHPNELIQMGVDFKIKTDGQGINMFPLNYGKNTDSSKDFYKDKNFIIKNLEIYKVLFK